MSAKRDTQQRGPDRRHVFGLATGLGVGGLLAALTAVVTAIDSVHKASVGSDRVIIAGLHFTYPTLNGAEALTLALAALGSAVVSIALRAGWRQRRAYHRFMARMGGAASLAGHPAVRVIDDPRPQAFCAGYLRPAVYVSKRTVDLLTDDELEAVLAHENHHLRVRDPLRFAFGRALSQALFFVPVLRPLCDRYSDLAELRADEAAIKASAGDKAPLASALLRVEANSNPEVAGISPERVDSLLGCPARWQLPWLLMAASIVTLSGLSVLIWRASEVASAHATFNLPLLSSQPCLAMLMSLPLVGIVGRMVLGRRQSRKPEAGRSSLLAILR